MTSHTAETPLPSVAVAVTVAVPALTAQSCPLVSTVTTDSSEEVKVMRLSEALAGEHGCVDTGLFAHWKGQVCLGKRYVGHSYTGGVDVLDGTDEEVCVLAGHVDDFHAFNYGYATCPGFCEVGGEV